MILSESLAAVRDITVPPYTRLRERIDPGWVEALLAGDREVRVRRRKLPASSVVWVVVAAALYSHLNFAEMVKRLGLTATTARGNEQAPPSSGSVAEARARLGDEAMQRVFRALARSWVAEPDVSAGRYNGLQVLAADGTTFLAPDTQRNRDGLGLPPTAEGRARAAFPQARLLALMDVYSHIVIDAVLGRYDDDERSMLGQIAGAIPANSLLLLDRGFRSWRLLLGIHRRGEERHWLLRGHDALVAETIEQLGPGDRLVYVFHGYQARRADERLPRRMRCREITYSVGGRAYRLLTSLLDSERFPAAELARMYRARWEIELAFDDIKDEQRASADVLRSKTPEGVRQEIWGILTAHNLVRVEMARAAALVGVMPYRISFHGSLQLVASQIQVVAEVTAPTKIASRQWLLRHEIAALVLPERRSQRHYPRAVKRVVSRYPKKRDPPPAGPAG